MLSEKMPDSGINEPSLKNLYSPGLLNILGSENIWKEQDEFEKS